MSHPFVETGVWRIKGSKVRDKNQSRFSRNVSTLKAPLRAWALTRKNVGGAWRGRRGRKQLFARNTESSPWFSGAAGEFMRMTECERTTASKAANQCWENAGSSSSRPHPTPMWSHGPGTLVMRSAGEALEPPEQTRTKQPAGFSHQPGRTENPAGPRHLSDRCPENLSCPSKINKCLCSLSGNSQVRRRNDVLISRQCCLYDSFVPRGAVWDVSAMGQNFTDAGDTCRKRLETLLHLL